MMVCPNCGEMKLAHVVCKACGYYDGKLVRELKVKDNDEEKGTEEKTDKKAKKAKKTKNNPKD